MATIVPARRRLWLTGYAVLMLVALLPLGMAVVSLFAPPAQGAVAAMSRWSC
jgi:hypothetical protein